MKDGNGGNLGLSREYHKKLYGPLFYTWWNCPLSVYNTGYDPLVMTIFGPFTVHFFRYKNKEKKTSALSSELGQLKEYDF